MIRARLASALLASVLLVACGNGDDSNPADAGTTADAGTNADAGNPTVDGGTGIADAGTNPEQCEVERSLGTLTEFTLTGSYYGTDEGGAWLQGNYAYNLDRDVVVLELYEGKGAFSGAPAPGTYTLAGDDLDYSTCGICVLLVGQYPSGPTYFATGGAVTLTSVQGRLTGTLDGVDFAHVDIEKIDETTYVTTPIDDGCSAQLDQLVFDDALEPAK